MEMTEKQKKSVLLASRVLYGEESNEFLEALSELNSFQDVSGMVTELASQARNAKIIDGDQYEKIKTTLRDALWEEEMKLEKEELMIREKVDEMEYRLEKKPGIKLARLSDTKVILIFKDDEEFEIEFDKVKGLRIRLGDDYFENDDIKKD